MPMLDTAANFRDDGGTPAWRANQATWHQTIDAFPTGIRGFLARARCVSFWWWLLFWLAWSFLGPITFGILAFSIAYAGDAKSATVPCILAGMFLGGLFIGHIHRKLYRTPLRRRYSPRSFR